MPQMVDNTEEEESEGESDEHKFVGDELRNGMGKIVRVFFNNYPIKVFVHPPSTDLDIPFVKHIFHSLHR